MKYPVEYEFDKDCEILIRKFKGTVSMNDIISSWEEIIAKNLISSKHKGVISDFRETNLQVDMRDMDKISAYFNDNITIFENLRLAQIIDSPLIAYPMIFRINNPKTPLKPFSTLEAAIIWVKR